VIARARGTYWLPDIAGPGLMRTLRRLLSPLVRPPFDIMGPRMISWIIAAPRLYARAPRALQDMLTARAVRPAGAGWLVPRLAAVRMTAGCTITHAAPTGGGEGGAGASQLRLTLSDGSERIVDHLLLGTGYRVDAKRYPFLSPAVRDALHTRDGYPELNPGFESSIPGLHFLGTPAAATFGPLCRFVVGSKYAARELTRVIAGQNGNGNGHHRSRASSSESVA
jgi:FAD-dependent urate hydroxylase